MHVLRKMLKIDLYRSILAAAILCAGGCASVSWVTKAPPRLHAPFPELEVIPVVPACRAERADAAPTARPMLLTPRTLHADTVVLYVCSAGCPPCRTGDVQIAGLARMLRSEEISADSHLPPSARPALAAVVLNASPRLARRTSERNAWTFPVFTDPDKSVRKRLGRVGTPCFCVLRAAGNERFVLAARHCGTFDNDDQIADFARRIVRIAAGAARKDPPPPPCDCCRDGARPRCIPGRICY